MKRSEGCTENLFFRNVEPRFEAFKQNICAIARKSGIEFDEDIFMETIIKCMKTFSTENATNTDVDRYFWKAFKLNTFTKATRNKQIHFVDIDTILDMPDEEPYNDDIDTMAEMVEVEVRRKYGDRVYEAWRHHICDDKTYKELEEMGYVGMNLHDTFRNIKNYLKGDFLKKNTYFKTLAVENNLI